MYFTRITQFIIIIIQLFTLTHYIISYNGIISVNLRLIKPNNLNINGEIVKSNTTKAGAFRLKVQDRGDDLKWEISRHIGGVKRSATSHHTFWCYVYSVPKGGSTLKSSTASIIQDPRCGATVCRIRESMETKDLILYKIFAANRVYGYSSL